MYQDTTPLWSFPHCPTPPAWEMDWNALQQQFHWLRAMDGILQSSIYHAEGDVLIHTGKVVRELTQLAAWRELPEQARSILFAAALLHDVGKPHCTQIEADGHISSRGHARIGEHMARRILWTAEELERAPPFLIREQIARLVRFHGLPLQFLDKPQPERAIIAASMSVRLDYVALLAEADVLGRICPDQAELLARIALFREYCQELRCYSQPRQFPSAHSRFLYFRKEQRDPDYAAYDNTMFEVVLMSSLPGAGKDTWIAQHLSSWSVIALDEIRKALHIAPEDNQGQVIQTAKERARELLRQQQSFVWNATNVTYPLRQSLVEFFASYGARVRIVYLDAPFPTILQRNRSRAASVPEAVIYKLLNKLDMPDATEAQRVDFAHLI